MSGEHFHPEILTLGDVVSKNAEESDLRDNALGKSIVALDKRVTILEGTNPPDPPDPPDPPPDVDLILTPGEPVNLRDATDVRVGWEPGTVVGRTDLENASNVHFLGDTPLTVDGRLDSGGPLQTGTVNLVGSEGCSMTRVNVVGSPRSAFSIEHASLLRLTEVSAVSAWHLGIHGGFLHDIEIINSLFENNSRRIPTAPGDQSEGWESGDMKLTNANLVLVEGNTCRSGFGPGIWFDIGCSQTRILKNRVFDKNAEGIFYEISGGGLIEGNEIFNSPTGLNSGRMNWMYGAGILLSTAQATIRNNVIDGSWHGITVLDQSWRDDTPDEYDASDYLIETNTVKNVNKVGAAQDSGSQDVFNPNAWKDNEYEGVREFVWSGGAFPN